MNTYRIGQHVSVVAMGLRLDGTIHNVRRTRAEINAGSYYVQTSFGVLFIPNHLISTTNGFPVMVAISDGKAARAVTFTTRENSDGYLYVTFDGETSPTLVHYSRVTYV